jgi:hypothetical protein
MRTASARALLGMTRAEFAEYLNAKLSGEIGYTITADSVEYYEEKDAPPGEVSEVCIAILGDTLEMPAPAASGDVVYPYAGRGLISREQWNGIIRGATGHLWLYGMAEQGYANDDAVPAILAEAVAAGCSVRVLLLDPDCPVAAAMDADEGSPPGTLPARIRSSLARFAAMRCACPAIEIRAYETYPTVSIVRGDGEMLVTPYLRYVLGSNSPTFALTSQSAPGLFSQWERHFESMWNNSRGRD